jgi:carbon storage regulator
MLILSRRAGERIVIGDDIVVTVVETGRDQVRIGIDAPRHVSVHRHEVYDEIVSENRAAGAVEPATTSGAVSAASLPRRPAK